MTEERKQESYDRLSENYVSNLSKTMRHRMRVELRMLEHRTKEEKEMNERIRELELEAMSIVLNLDDPNREIEKMYIPREFTKKFAELIIKECGEFVDPVSCNLMFKHFGIEQEPPR